ncbi:hypothetical protein JB92DRAFT_3050248 [Gautieria morchelliformis]|nr:hypothetical protein JB92DRAFT_3050248 [Gautieria morchelliformis]
MATRSGKTYSERPASAATDSPSPYNESPQEPGHEETSMDLGDDIEIATSPVSDDEYSDLERAEGAALDDSQSTEDRTPPLEVETGTSADGPTDENRHEVMTCRPRPVDADGADPIERCPRSADGADLTNHCRSSASDDEVDNEYVDTESSEDGFLPAQRTTGKATPPNGHAIIRSNTRYFKDWFSDHCPGLPTTPPDCISTQRAPTLETPERAGRESPAWRVRRPSPATLDHDEDPYREFMIGIFDNMDSKSLREMIEDRARRMSHYADVNNSATSELTAPSMSHHSKSTPRAKPRLTAAQKEKWRARELNSRDAMQQ